VLLIGHLDVVEARREDWSTDPFELIEKDGYFYGRGTSDMKDGDAIMVTTLLRMRQEGYRPSRDIILALTADEESGCCNGPEWLLQNRRDLVDAEFVLNHDGSSVVSEHGVAQLFRLGASQKVYADYQLTVSNRGGHSSLPRPDNAIYELAEGLLKIGHHSFPFELNPVTRAYFERVSRTNTGETAADMRAVAQTPPDAQAIERLAREPSYGAITRTTCVATRLDGGHANNALPQRAQAVVNCRILPGGTRRPHQNHRRPADHRSIHHRHGRDHGHRLRSARLPAAPAGAGGAATARGRGGRHLAGYPRDPGHELGRLRCGPYERCRLANLWSLRYCSRPR
jgi:acetylornithine deacetylase/succinyl-diaminopimelate desuccinylase-like protein